MWMHRGSWGPCVAVLCAWLAGCRFDSTGSAPPGNGNNNNNDDCDGCTADCGRVDNDCGDNIQECGEACDDGNNDGCDGCAPNCSRVDNHCGDNIGVVRGLRRRQQQRLRRLRSGLLPARQRVRRLHRRVRRGL